MSLSKGGSGRGEDTKRMVSVVGLYCCSANHEVPFAGPGDCEVVRLYDFEENMCSLFPRKGAARRLTICAEGVGGVVADVESAVLNSLNTAESSSDVGDSDNEAKATGVASLPLAY